MKEDLIEFGIKTNVECIIREKVNEEINEEVEKFRRKLEDRKDDYIAEVMKGIRIVHERDIGSMGINYKVIFENVYRLEERKKDER